MKYIGGISLFFESKGYGFINSSQLKAEGYGSDMFFHISDCSFTPKRYAYVIFELKRYKDKTKAINVESPTQEVDYLVENWSQYSDGDKAKFIAAFLNDWKEDLVLRKKLVEAANRYTEIEDEKLKDLFSSITEISLIESSLEVDCKKIIDDIVSDVFLRNYADYDFSFSNEIPSREEISQSVMRFWQNFKPSILYTHTVEDGYWHTRWKWDGSEDSWRDGKEYYEVKSLNNFSIKGLSINLNYTESNSGSCGKDMNSVILRVYSKLMNSRSLWNNIDSVCRNRKEQLIKEVFDNVCNLCRQPILESLSQYFITKFPKNGEFMYNQISRIYGKFWIKEINDSLTPYKYICFIQMGNLIKKHIIDINSYISTSIKNRIEGKCTSLPHSDAFTNGKINKDGMYLSVDGKILYSLSDLTVQEVIIPESVSFIADGAFIDCRNLKKIQFLSPITHIGHEILLEAVPHSNYGYYSSSSQQPNNQLEIIGDFSQLSYIGYNTSSLEIVVNGESKTIAEWSYIYNKEIIDNTDITIKEVHIEHEDD